MRHVTTAAPAKEGLGTVLAAWAGFAALVAATGALGRAPQLVPVVVVALVAAQVLAYRLVPAWRSAARALDLRVVVLAHAIRLPIGALFLVELARGALPPLFALRAGWGDVAVGVLALVVLVARARPRLVLAWSVLGLVDILMVVVTANYVMFVRHDPLLPAAMARFAYALLPTFVVPLVIASHALVIARRGA